MEKLCSVGSVCGSSGFFVGYFEPKRHTIIHGVGCETRSDATGDFVSDCMDDSVWTAWGQRCQDFHGGNISIPKLGHEFIRDPVGAEFLLAIDLFQRPSLRPGGDLDFAAFGRGGSHGDFLL